MGELIHLNPKVVTRSPNGHREADAPGIRQKLEQSDEGQHFLGLLDGSPRDPPKGAA